MECGFSFKSLILLLYKSLKLSLDGHLTLKMCFLLAMASTKRVTKLKLYSLILRLTLSRGHNVPNVTLFPSPRADKNVKSERRVRGFYIIMRAGLKGLSYEMDLAQLCLCI